MPGTCDAIFEVCDQDNDTLLSEGEWDGCSVDESMVPTRVQAFAIIDNAPRNGRISLEEYATHHEIGAEKVKDVVFSAPELALTDFRREPLSAIQLTFKKLDTNNTGRACCLTQVNDGEPFTLANFEAYLASLPSDEANKLLQSLMHVNSPHGSAMSSLRVGGVLSAVVVLVTVLVVIATRGRRVQKEQGHFLLIDE